MFTGIITDIGQVISIEKKGDVSFEIGTKYDVSSIDIGASISCSGVCLTVVDKVLSEGFDRARFVVAASAETLSKTTLGGWKVGTSVNLERSLKVGDELGGHIVSGHVDGTAEILSISEDGDSIRFVLEVSDDLSRYVAPKGSVALDGVSLTVNEVNKNTFGVNIILHTQHETTFGMASVGKKINFEIDVLARYVARLAET